MRYKKARVEASGSGLDPAKVRNEPLIDVPGKFGERRLWVISGVFGMSSGAPAVPQ